MRSCVLWWRRFVPTARDPRTSVRFAPDEWADVQRAATVAGVSTGALIRFCAVNWCAKVAADRAAARVSGEALPPLRTRTGVRAVKSFGPPR